MTETLARSEPAAAPAPQGRSAAPTPRIGLLSWTGIENIGNEACLEATLNFLRANMPEAQLISASAGPENVERQFAVSGPHLRWLPKNRWLKAADKLLGKVPSALVNWRTCQQTLAKLDYLIVPGGSLIDDYRTHSLDRPMTMRRWFFGAKKRGVKILFISVGTDPVRKKHAEGVATPITALATYKSYRDTGSRDYIASLGFDETNTPIYPDLVWGLPEPADPPHSPDAPLTVGIGVMAYHGWKSIEAGSDVHERYVNQLAEFADWLAGNKYRVRLIVGEKSDERVVNAICERARSVGGPYWCDQTPAKNIHDVMRQITETDVMIATRFHNILPALKLGRPTISISYMRKNTELMQQIGTPQYFQTLEGLDVEKLKQQFNEVVANRAALSAAIRARVVEIKAKLKEQEERLMRDVFRAG